jgi:hypothetical protein
MTRWRPVMLSGLACAALMLAGCDFVMTVTAMFTPGDAAGAPVLKPGYWSSTVCTADGAAARAPICAGGYLLTRTEMREVMPPGDSGALGPQRGQTETYLLVAGDPMVMQIAYTNPEVSPEPGAYIFVAVEPTARDEAGRIVAAEVWPVICGPAAPPPKPDAPVDMDGFPPATDHPFPGMTLDDVGCLPADKAALFNAAKASHTPDNIGLALHWVAEKAP